ncbi:uncharacterized protein LOC129005631 isoform X2 [Macrosteles quadrilineatus]|uniref:uncharacterized protein LOC129005631 isoform X2 n=1 Tax=Macrosteles quadrilineatus TaxID=74068 RepID=UPI0023E2D96E|nr:uncharacterized protein LOC129005631 isoform X2 [Macrosteles quadrilineatus]
MVSPELLTEGSLNHNHTDNTNSEPTNTSTTVDNSNPSIQPSYLNLACCISGYTTLTTYNSKQREGFRSRDISPARITGAGADDAVFTSLCGNYLSAQPRYLTEMDHRKKSGDGMMNGNSNGASTFTCSSTSVTANSSFYRCETRKEILCHTDTSSALSHSKEVPSQTSSFILQRVERLYGPGALAQGFYTRRSHGSSAATTPHKEPQPDESVKAGDEGGASALPVLRLLRPEFRAQLSLAKRKSSCPSTRVTDSTDGAVERIIPVVIADNDVETKSHSIKEERETVNKPVEKDGPYYLQLVTNEAELLERLAAMMEVELSQGVPDHMEGRLRAAAGKARLLANQKLAQFKGLCHKNIIQDMSEDFPTTCEDLAGFWDMVCIQVNSVHEEFNQIDILRKAGWPVQEIPEDKKKAMNGASGAGPRKAKALPTSAPAPAKSSLSKARDEARKRMLAERRKEMRKNANTTDDIVIV